MRRKKPDPAGDAIVVAIVVSLAPSVVIAADKSGLELLARGFNVKVSVG